jgi:hypothetical protein
MLKKVIQNMLNNLVKLSGSLFLISSLIACGGGSDETANTNQIDYSKLAADLNAQKNSKCSWNNLIGKKSEEKTVFKSDNYTSTTNYYYSLGFNCTETCSNGVCTTSSFEYKPIL